MSPLKIEYKVFGGEEHASVYLVEIDVDGEGKMVLGSADAQQLSGGDWYLNRCVVLENRGAPRGQGLGSGMLQRLLKRIREKNPGVQRIFVDPGGYIKPTLENQRQQFRFYVKNGFKATPTEGRLEYVF